MFLTIGQSVYKIIPGMALYTCPHCGVAVAFPSHHEAWHKDLKNGKK